jgi:serine/threonine-protein kinase
MTFEMLAGKPPFTGDTLAAVIHAIVYTPTPSLAALAADTPAAIVAAIERAMEKNRDARFPDVNSFVKAVTSRSLATAPTVPAAQVRVVAAPTERVERGRSSASFFIILGVAVVASVGVAIWKTQPRETEEAPLPSQTQPAATTPTTTNTTTPPPPANADSPTPPEPKAAEPRAPESAKARAGQEAKEAKEAKDAKDAKLSPEAARDLDDADAALASGKPAEALRLAQHSLYAQKSSRAYAIIARARCAEGDLGNAKAALAQVAGRDRVAVVRACGKMGVDLH